MTKEYENDKDNIFTEQAEYIDEKAFEKWSAVHPNENQIIKKLVQFGAKVIIGPRGCGKTTLMLKSYYKNCNVESEVLPVYVNFKLSLKMEPLYRTNTNASYWFNQWLYFKIYQGLIDTLVKLRIVNNIDLLYSQDDVIEILNLLEVGQIDKIRDNYILSVSTLVNEINEILEHMNKSHCVLLLDDAAHAFSAEQQKDFFDFFRQIKSRAISPKAAIYPGTTVYSASFHVGHDAEEIDV